jgi:hypothetical protein
MWMGFKEYLIKENQSVSSIKNKISYAKRFHYVLESINAHELSKLTPDVKVHAMKALASCQSSWEVMINDLTLLKDTS